MGEDIRMDVDEGVDQGESAAVVRCRACGVVLTREEAQATRWKWWTEEREHAFPLCDCCAEGRFGPAA
jgi:hypothetical protein